MEFIGRGPKGPRPTSPKISSPLQEFLWGAGAILPLVLGAAPFGLIYGTLAPSSGLSFAAALAMSLLVFAGSAQFIALGLLAVGTSLPLIIFTTLVVNVRHLLYALSLLPHVRHLGAGWRLILGFFLTDEAFAIAITRYDRQDRSPYKHWYVLGGALLMYLNWQLWTLLGLFLGERIPDARSWGLDFAMSVTFIGMIMPYLKTQPMVLSALVAGAVAVVARDLPHQLGLVVGASAGMMVGAVLETLQARKTP
ncbi:MAG: AzlC family ABC transporter permease [Synechococcaceae cyanobacterium SM2_3_1]|nr:AzlC family ABC transporter permease [Synechococcaceae cyanobacterium SM2_3_1]